MHTLCICLPLDTEHELDMQQGFQKSSRVVLETFCVSLECALQQQVHISNFDN